MPRLRGSSRLLAVTPVSTRPHAADTPRRASQLVPQTVSDPLPIAAVALASLIISQRRIIASVFVNDSNILSEVTVDSIVTYVTAT